MFYLPCRFFSESSKAVCWTLLSAPTQEHHLLHNQNHSHAATTLAMIETGGASNCFQPSSKMGSRSLRLENESPDEEDGT